MYFLTDKGDSALFAALKGKVSGFLDQPFGDWVGHAEAQALTGQWSIELLPHETISGKDETLKLNPEWFFRMEPKNAR
jgi:hypothetical protein